MKLIHNVKQEFNDIAKALIINAEGFSASWYNDQFGNATIGYGFAENGIGKDLLTNYINNKSLLMLETDASIILERIIQKIILLLNKKIYWFRLYNNINKKAVLIDMAYNLGITQFLSFDIFLNYLENDRIDYAVNNLTNTLWYNQVKNRAIRDCLNLYANEINYYLI